MVIPIPLCLFTCWLTLQMLAICPCVPLWFRKAYFPLCLPSAKLVSDAGTENETERERERESLRGIIEDSLRGAPVARAEDLWCSGGSPTLCKGTSALTFWLTRESSRVEGMRALMHAHPSSGRLQAPESSTNKHPLRANDGPQRGSQAQLSFCFIYSPTCCECFCLCWCARPYGADISRVNAVLISNYAHLPFL